MALAACSQDSRGSNTPSEKENQTAEQGANVYPVSFKAYLATDEIIGGEVVLLIEATNTSDAEISIDKSDFSFEDKNDKTLEFNRVEHESEDLILAPNETGILFNYNQLPDALTIPTIDPSQYQVTYTGMYYNQHKPMDIQTEIPKKYQETVQNTVNTLKEELQARIAEQNEAAEASYQESNPIKITGYAMDDDGSIYIRVENVTDEDFYYDTTYLKVFDTGYEYDEAPISDSAFDTTVSIPAHETFEYKDFFLLSNPSDQSEDEIASQIFGVHYHTEYPMATEYDIYGNYETELPADFTLD